MKESKFYITYKHPVNGYLHYLSVLAAAEIAKETANFTDLTPSDQNLREHALAFLTLLNHKKTIPSELGMEILTKLWGDQELIIKPAGQNPIFGLRPASLTVCSEPDQPDMTSPSLPYRNICMYLFWDTTIRGEQ